MVSNTVSPVRNKMPHRSRIATSAGALEL